MIQNILTTHITGLVLLLFAISTILIILEIKTNAKALLAILGILVAIAGIIVSFIMAVPLFEIMVLIMICVVAIFVSIGINKQKGDK